MNLHPKKKPTTPPVYYKTRARVEIKHEKRQKHYKNCGFVIKNSGANNKVVRITLQKQWFEKHHNNPYIKQ